MPLEIVFVIHFLMLCMLLAAAIAGSVPCIITCAVGWLFFCVGWEDVV